MTPRRARLVLVLVSLGVVGVGLFAWEPIFHFVMTEKRYWAPDPNDPEFGSNEVRGYYRRKRGGVAPLGKSEVWYVANGMKAHEAFCASRDSLLPTHSTYWGPDGAVVRQLEHPANWKLNPREKPPWLWGVTDQTAPSMPAWMKDDEKWQAALDAQD